MSRNSRTNKRPCRICGRWFDPHPRLGDRQKTCGHEECRREWHRRQCSDWNRRNSAYFKSNYLRKKLDSLCPSEVEGARAHDASAPEPGRKAQLPLLGFQDVISIQHIIIIEYLIRHLFFRFQEVIKVQHADKPG